MSLKEVFNAYQKYYFSGGEAYSGYSNSDSNYFTVSTTSQYKTTFTAVKPVRVFYYQWDLTYTDGNRNYMSGTVSSLYTATFDVGQTKTVGGVYTYRSEIHYAGARAYLLEEL